MTTQDFTTETYAAPFTSARPGGHDDCLTDPTLLARMQRDQEWDAWLIEQYEAAEAGAEEMGCCTCGVD